MEELYIELMEYLGENARDLGLATLDEDYGQLEAMLNGEDGYPIPFPALLISFGETQWESLSLAWDQRGSILVTTRLAFDCYDDTHMGSGQREYARERYRKARLVHKKLRGQKMESLKSTPLVRVASRTQALPHGIKVYETDYRIRITEKDQGDLIPEE